jgi:hypothetical protein
MVLAPLFLLPWIARKLRSWYRTRVVCAFLAFLDPSETTVGCLLHPSLWKGVDGRKAAFGMLAGMGCGPADYLCSAARRFEASSGEEKRCFSEAVRALDWFEYSLEASTFKETSHAGHRLQDPGPQRPLRASSPNPL